MILVQITMETLQFLRDFMRDREAEARAEFEDGYDTMMAEVALALDEVPVGLLSGEGEE